ncbi:hypothetical protein GGR57DRAFT_519171 [Xylariaceae sp. FL1272]|nr:hypothetical protein GGR57DRAFT_519171 [Xylariaceae sp. FL1272]
MQLFNLMLAFTAHLASLTNATPLASIVPRDNPCDGINALPKFYHEYREDECPAIHKFEPQIPEQCQGVTQQVQCASFCQVRTEFQWGREVPLTGTYCHGPFTCAVSSSDTITIPYQGGMELESNTFNALVVGVTAGYTQQDAHAVSQDYNFELKENECGYFTGTLSHGDNPIEPGACQNIVNEQNWCDTTVWTDDGQADGEIVFIKTDCGTRQPLPIEQQDKVYQRPGVALNGGDVANMLNTWVQDTCKVDYQFFDDYFQVTGKNWSPDLLGPNGDNLKNAIGHCGKLTSWHFQMGNDNSWFADGKLPIGVKSCVGTQVVNAGGSSAGGCRGAG